MQRGIRKGDAILVQVVAHGNLTAKSITTTVKVNFVVLVVASLYQDRYVQVGNGNGIDDTNLKAEIGQRYNDAVNAVTVLPKQFGTLQAVFTGFDTATSGRRSIFRKDNIVVAFVFKNF